ncbi:Translation initiation inhibitor [Alloactinosynnema sp. L-07]|uniref:RidA family protein n=1 Tax=Alloactinosynnema sp. L-07 TaxID=1653480 RepID=UPI00065F08FF|nr:RidA family protein [Alloactinosynnema sp. L-07]CRK57287.1 Translation initiation inhibitor [Alloactinosynnema sp. L-07]
MSAEARIKELGIDLPELQVPAGIYLPVRRSGPTVYVSGNVPSGADPSVPVIGHVGGELTVEQGKHAARLTALNLLAALRWDLGSLDRITGILKVFGMVKCAPGFNRTPEVINGCSELLVEIFGDSGRHARSAIGVAELPFGMAVEIEMVAEFA